MRVFTARETGVRTMAWSAAQDAAGTLYFGCDTVVSFDGDRWTPQSIDPTYSIRGLDFGPDGRLWAGGVNEIGWFEKGALGRLRYHSLTPELPPGIPPLGDVWRVYAEGADRALFVTRDRILRWSSGKFVSWAYPGMRLLWSMRTARAVYVHYPPLSPREVLDAVVKMLEPRSGGAHMEAVVDPGLPDRILGDAARIQQVVVNFAANALKFGGTRVTLSARPDESRIVFAVRDDGVGIAQEEQKGLFVRFSRASSVRHAAIPGTGLGLAVSRVLAERMGGSVGVESVPGRGSTFFLRLPMTPAPAAASAAAPFDARGARALVVEDIAYNARALAAMLAKLGFRAEVAQDGREALARLAALPYGAVFMDCDLPGMNGIDVARSFRAIERLGRRTLIVATTALSTVEDRTACLAAGMDAFLTKPVTPEKLLAVLSASGGARDGAPAGGGPTPGAPGLDLALLRHLADGSPGGLGAELTRLASSLDEAVRALSAAAAGPRAGVASAAHRMLSHARMVGAAELASAASDLQEFAAVYTEAELAGEAARVARCAAELRGALDRLGRPGPTAG